jgi:hypothetical protein
MNIKLGLRAAAVLAVVAASTAALVTPELIGGAKADPSSAIAALLIFGPH